MGAEVDGLDALAIDDDLAPSSRRSRWHHLGLRRPDLIRFGP